MITIARLRVLEALKDARFVFLCALVILAFLFNGVVTSQNYRLEHGSYREALAENVRLLEDASSDLQRVAALNQHFQQPFSPLSGVASGGSRMLPNMVVLNAFASFDSRHQHTGNYMLPLLNDIDWSFIISGLMTLLAVVVSFGAVSGEKQNGTLRQTLANPLSRLALFLGNYVGLMAVLAVALLLGVLVNLLTISLLEGPPLDGEVLAAVAWAVLLALLLLSAFVFAGLAASSMARHPVVSLVIMLIVWVIAVVAMPGIGRLLSEQLVDVPSQQVVEAEQERTGDEIWNSYPGSIGRFSGNPFEPQMPQRAEASSRITDAQQRIRDDAEQARVRQASLALQLASVSPCGLFSDGLQTLCGTGMHGYVGLRENAERYRRQLHEFIVSRDAMDNESAHLVYGNRGTERNTFSTKEVPLAAIPRQETLWLSSGLSRVREWPLWQAFWLLVFNLLAGLAAFIALMRYDPR